MGRQVSISNTVLVEMFPYMRIYSKLPRKKKKAMKRKLTKDVNNAISAFIKAQKKAPIRR